MALIPQFGLFNGILVLLLILAYSFRRSINKIFLGLSIFFVWYSLLITYLNLTGAILQYPDLQRTGLLAAYLAFPFLYIYSRNTFYPGKLWRIGDWILLLPAVMYVIDLVPFFLLSPEEKIAIWRENLADSKKMLLANEGWLGLQGFHFAFAYVWIAIIMYFQVKLILRNWNLDSGFKTAHNRRLLYFIVMITLLYLPLFVPGIFGILLKRFWFNATFIAFTYGVSLSAIAIYLLIYPNILYGFLPEVKFSFPNAKPTDKLPQPEPVNQSKQEEREEPVVIPETLKPQNDPVKKSATEQEMTPELAIVLQHMEENKPYLKQGFTIQNLSNQTQIPVYQLSPLINGYFKMNFANWINRYRIEYFIEQALQNPNITLEALSQDAGFISRSTFINAFKREKGVTPKEYLKEHKVSSQQLV